MAAWISHIILCAILTQQLYVCDGQPSIREASTCPPTPVTCASSASKFVIRTATYVTAEDCTRRSSCSGSDCKMSEDDIMKVYRKCSENVTSCDLSSAGVSSDFSISYYCLDNDIKDPCEDGELRWRGSGLSLFIDFARYAASRDFACKCHVTDEEGAGNQIVEVSAMNMFESRAGFSGPDVVIESEDWDWTFGKRLLPTLWQMDAAANLTFRGLNAASFGHLWIDLRLLRGQSLQIYCNSTLDKASLITSPPPGFVTSESVVFPTSSTGNQPQSTPSLVIIIGAAAAGLSFVILVIIVVVVAIKCRRMKARNKELENLKLPSHELRTMSRSRSGGIHNPAGDGDYCIINDVKPPPVVGVCKSRDHKSADDSKERWSPYPNYRKNGGGGYGLSSHDFAYSGYDHTASDFETTSLESESSWRDYKPSSRDHKFALKDYDREHSLRDDELRSRGYKPTPRDYDREQRSYDYGPTSSDYELTAYEYEPATRDADSCSRDHEQSSRDYEPTPRDYERASRNYKAVSHVYKPAGDLQRSIAYDAQRKASQRKSRHLEDRNGNPTISVISRGEDMSIFAPSSSHRHPRDSADVGVRVKGPDNMRWQDSGSTTSPSAASSDYDSLRHQPGQLTSPGADNVIYDRAGYFRAENGEDVYNKLKYGKPRAQVIDNIYDNSTFV